MIKQTHMDINDLVKKIVIDWKEQVKGLSDSELKEDRSNWMKMYGRHTDPDYKTDEFDSDIHTIALELEQLRRWKKIYYDDIEMMVKDLYNQKFIPKKLKDMLNKLKVQLDKDKS